MISCTQADLLLDGLLDGGLQGHERHAVEEHLAACAACRATLQGLRDLQAAARSAPRAVPPPAGTWAAVAAQRPTALRRRVTLPAWALAAAAALLLVAGASVAAWLSRPAPPPVVVAGTGVLPPELADLEREYLEAAAELTRALDAHRANLPEESRLALERSVAVVDAAIAEARAAATAAPEATGPLLLAAHQRKLALLQQANRLLVPS